MLVVLVAASVWLSHVIQYDEHNVTVIWPAGALAVLLVLRFGNAAILPVFLGTEAYHVFFLSPYEPLLNVVSVANTFSAVAGVWVFKRYAGDNLQLTTVKNALLIVCVVSVVQALTSAIPGMMVIAFLYIDNVHDFWLSFTRWVLSDIAGVIICLPALMMIRFKQFVAHKLYEVVVPLVITIAGLLALYLMSQTVIKTGLSQYPVLLLSMPLSIWLALSYRSSIAIFCLTLLVIGTVAINLKSLPVVNDQIILYVQGYASIIMSCGILLNVSTREKRVALSKLEQQAQALECEVENRTKDLALQVEETQLLAKQLKQLSNTDYLTCIDNRRAFMEHFSKTQYLDDRESYYLVLLDVDHFKRINDKYGHDIGDRCLVAVASLLSHFAQQYNGKISRWGGEEFAGLFQFANTDAAVQFADLLRQKISETDFNIDGLRLNITVSIGVNPWCCSDAETLKLADKGLYRAKEKGRNQVVSMICQCGQVDEAEALQQLV